MDGMMNADSLSADIDVSKVSSTRNAMETTSIALNQLYEMAYGKWPGRHISVKREWKDDWFTVTLSPWPEEAEEMLRKHRASRAA